VKDSSARVSTIGREHCSDSRSGAALTYDLHRRSRCCARPRPLAPPRSLWAHVNPNYDRSSPLRYPALEVVRQAFALSTDVESIVDALLQPLPSFARCTTRVTLQSYDAFPQRIEISVPREKPDVADPVVDMMGKGQGE